MNNTPYYLLEVYFNSITYRSLPLLYHNLGNIAYFLPVADPCTETFHVLGNLDWDNVPTNRDTS